MSALRKRSENFVATTLGEEVLIVDLDGGELFSLSGTARSVWDAIDGSCSEAHIAELMAERHEGEATQIAADVAALVNDLEKAALIERVA